MAQDIVRSGKLHKYYENLVAFEYTTLSGHPYSNVLVFVGGLGDGLTTVPYIPALVRALEKIGWGVIEVLLTSSYVGWGTGCLARDARDITEAIKYFKKGSEGSKPKSKIVLMGHSTGTQDTMYYLTQQYEGDSNSIGSRPEVQGAILQACASDRDALLQFVSKEKADSLLQLAKDWVADNRGSNVLPVEYTELFMGAPISATRWVSLQDVRGGDDFFSVDLLRSDHEKTFGVVKTKLLVLCSGNDEFMSNDTDKEKLVQIWKSATDSKYWSEFSAVVKGASHNIGPSSDDGALVDAVDRVVKFISTID